MGRKINRYRYFPIHASLLRYNKLLSKVSLTRTREDLIKNNGGIPVFAICLKKKEKKKRGGGFLYSRYFPCKLLLRRNYVRSLSLLYNEARGGERYPYLKRKIRLRMEGCCERVLGWGGILSLLILSLTVLYRHGS
jgi:hypothetical protein